MEWTLRLVGTGIDGQSRSFDVMPISRPDGLGEIANLGLTLGEAKQLLAQVGGCEFRHFPNLLQRFRGTTRITLPYRSYKSRYG